MHHIKEVVAGEAVVVGVARMAEGASHHSLASHVSIVVNPTMCPLTAVTHVAFAHLVITKHPVVQETP